MDTHFRETVLADVMAAADHRLDGSVPWSDVPGADKAFDTADDLVSALQMRWHTRLAGSIEAELDAEPLDLPQAVIHAWRVRAAAMPGVRRILDAYADAPSMQIARRKEWVLLASASGLAAINDPKAAAVGKQLECRARSESDQRPLLTT